MVSSNIPPIIPQQYAAGQGPQKARIIPQDLQTQGKTDLLSLGKGKAPTTEQSMQVVYERAMAKLQSVVSDARAQLGIPEDAVIDTSPEATAGRIAEFALGFFENWRENDEARMQLSDEEARKQFADFIGGAISQGIAEARDILGSLNALNDEIGSQIDQTQSLVQERLEAFILNGE